MSTWLIVAGLALSLVGAYVASTLPIVKMFRTAGSWGGGSEEKKASLEKQVRWKSLLANILLVLGTALQIFGSLASR